MNICQIAENYKGILLDAYGVFWGGNATGPLLGSKELMQELISQGRRVGILSNSTQLAQKEISKLQSSGIIQGTHYHFLATSGEVAKHYFAYQKLPFTTPSNLFWVLGAHHPKFAPSHPAIFEETSFRETRDIRAADFIYIGIPHKDGQDQTDPECFRGDVEALKMHNLPMVCFNPDRFAHEGQPPKRVVRQGSIAALYEEMGGKVHYIGKPYAHAFDYAMSHFAPLKPAEVLMVGDTPETDIRGARLAGLATALITETGIMADRIAEQGLEQAMRLLPTSDKPDFTIRRFAHVI